MRKAAIFVGLFLLCDLTAAQADPCQLVRYAQISIPDSGGHGVLVPVGINGTKTQFLVDTGSFLSEVSETIVAAQNLPRLKDEGRIYSADGRTTTEFVDIAELDIDRMHTKNSYLVVMPADRKVGTVEIGGLLGANVLKLFDLDFDFGGHAFNLLGPNSCGAGVVYWSSRAGGVPFELSGDGNKIVVPVTLDGESFRAIVDTGSSFTLISEGEIKRRFGVVPGGPGADKIANLPKDFMIQYQHQFKALTLGDITINAPVVGLEPDDMNNTIRNDLQRHSNIVRGDVFTPEMIIGMDVLSKLHFYISYGQRMIYVTPSDVGHPAAGTATASSAHWNSGG